MPLRSNNNSDARRKRTTVIIRPWDKIALDLAADEKRKKGKMCSAEIKKNERKFLHSIFVRSVLIECLYVSEVSNVNRKETYEGI